MNDYIDVSMVDKANLAFLTASVGGIQDIYNRSSNWYRMAHVLDSVAEAMQRDEYHTMDELYHYRMLYNALAANAMPEISVKSWKHSDGEECFGGGWFVVCMNLPTGQVSNHYKSEHWDLFSCSEVKLAPEYDGHTPQIAADRMLEFLKSSNG